MLLSFLSRGRAVLRLMLAKKDALSDTRTNIYDLHEKKLEYFESEKRKLSDYIISLEKLKVILKTSDEKWNISKQITLLETKINCIQDDNELNEYLLEFFLTINKDPEDLRFSDDVDPISR